MDALELKREVANYIDKVTKLENYNMSTIRSRQVIEKQIQDLLEENKRNKEALDIGLHAIDILRQVSDQTVQEAYKFLEGSINTALAEMFTRSTRKIRIREYTRGVQYPQLVFEMDNGNGKIRSLKAGGHGVAQIVSLLSILCIIVITGARRILILDEVLSGVSQSNLMVIDEVLWSFTEIGFQFIINDHGFIPKGSHVYHLEAVNDISHLKDDYASEYGVYRQSTNLNAKSYDYSQSDHRNFVVEEEQVDNVTHAHLNNTSNSDFKADSVVDI